MSFDVSGKVALVTGANRGIGKSITQKLLDCGVAKVYAAVRNTDSVQPLIEAHSDRVAAVTLDLSKPETITAAAKMASDVQLVINNAGVLRTSDPFDDAAIDNLQFEIDVNVFGLIRMAQAFIPVLKTNGGGAFVQLNSVASLKNFADFSTYCASKACSYSMTQAIRDKVAGDGVQVLSVHPGPIATDMADSAGLSEGAFSPSVVADGIVDALKTGQFRLFPDDFAKQFEAAYAGFAEAIVDANLMEG